ncbi:hypothetical protein OEZ85_008400 [Tetradesmus obliquus]|uniref:Anaphase-promoting complex subunit 4 WD40 domain-containing protein n=1 Tax=Tetradesmus obliquus TaxID=3088 RepID=A0ABY8TME0_TETOB|nr:hypothetical protein OEZ85_008400 [Tetradesmus obliquus]
MSHVANGCKFLTVGDEEGCVSIVDTSAEELPTSLYTDHDRPPRAKWLAHNNTIFDMAWAKNDSVLYTASGDQHVGVWDTAAGRLRVYCAGHDGSVKAVCPHSTQPDVFASGSRDGGILLWDLRTPSKWCAAKRRMQLGPILRIDIATAPARQHGGPTTAAAAAAAPGSAGKAGRPGSGRSAAGAANCRRSVTSLLFLRNEHTMVSSSDMDGVVKLWDLRRLTAPTGDITLPARGSPAAAAAGRKSSGSGRSRSGGSKKGSAAADEAGGACWMGFSCPSRSSRPAGISSMALSPAGDMLLVSSIDSCHYLYSMAALDQPPLATLTGHRSDSFCVKSCFSPCGQHVLSGSSDRRAYIWDVSQPSLPPVTLPGHAGEVTAVAWCPGDACQLATAADDATLRVWSMDRSNARYQATFDHCNYLFAEEGRQQQGLWDRLGFERPKAPAQQTREQQRQALHLVLLLQLLLSLVPPLV